MVHDQFVYIVFEPRDIDHGPDISSVHETEELAEQEVERLKETKIKKYLELSEKESISDWNRDIYKKCAEAIKNKDAFSYQPYYTQYPFYTEPK